MNRLAILLMAACLFLSACSLFGYDPPNAAPCQTTAGGNEIPLVQGP